MATIYHLIYHKIFYVFCIFTFRIFFKLFFACDAIIFPYRVVSISGVLFDALAHGLQFVLSDLSFFQEFEQMDLGITCRRDANLFENH